MLSFVRYYRFVEILSCPSFEDFTTAATDGAIEDFTTSDGAIRGLNSSCVVVVSFVSQVTSESTTTACRQKT